MKGLRFELIGAAIMQYASKWLPGLQDGSSHSIDEGWNQGSGLHMIISGTGNKDDLTGSQIREQRMVIESLISIIPPQKDCVSCSFLLRLLRLANMLEVQFNMICRFGIFFINKIFCLWYSKFMPPIFIFIFVFSPV